jgi:hypothetical protein
MARCQAECHDAEENSKGQERGERAVKKFELLDYVLLFVVVILLTVAACLTKPTAERPGMKEARLQKNVLSVRKNNPAPISLTL